VQFRASVVTPWLSTTMRDRKDASESPRRVFPQWGGTLYLPRSGKASGAIGKLLSGANWVE